MRWVKVLAIAAGILIVFIVVSSLVHILYLIGVGVVIIAAILLAFKAWQQYKSAQQRHEERRLQRQERREERRPGRSIEARPPQYPGTSGVTGTSGRQAVSGQPNIDIEEELARLRREKG